MPMYFALVKYILIVKFQVIDLKGKKIYIFTFINNTRRGIAGIFRQSGGDIPAVQRGYSGGIKKLSLIHDV